MKEIINNIPNDIEEAALMLNTLQLQTKQFNIDIDKQLEKALQDKIQSNNSDNLGCQIKSLLSFQKKTFIPVKS